MPHTQFAIEPVDIGELHRKSFIPAEAGERTDERQPVAYATDLSRRLNQFPDLIWRWWNNFFRLQRRVGS